MKVTYFFQLGFHMFVVKIVVCFFLKKEWKNYFDTLQRPTLSYFPTSLCPKSRPSCADTITLLVSEWGRKDSKVFASHFCLWGSGSLQQRNSRAKQNVLQLITNVQDHNIYNLIGSKNKPIMAFLHIQLIWCQICTYTNCMTRKQLNIQV